MSGIFSSMNTATKGLMAQQTALHTTGHNIANINTEGFSRQRVDMKSDRAYNLNGVGYIGTGVKMESVERMVNNHVSKQIRNENSTLNRHQEKSSVIDQLEVIFNEPSDTGLSFNIGEMFKAFSGLANTPESLNSKTVVVEKLKTLTATLNQMAGQIESLEKETHSAIDKNVLDFNSTVEELKNLNQQIHNMSKEGQKPNDLLDQRDLMLKKLTAISDVDLEFEGSGDGRVSIKMDGQDILSYEGEKQNQLKYDGKGGMFLANKDGKLIDKDGKTIDDIEDGKPNYASKNAIEIEVKNGKLKGNIDAVEDIEEASNDLDKMAKTMAKAINNTHGDLVEAGFIFTSKNKLDGITAKNIEVNEALRNNNDLLQAGKGDNSIALDLTRLENKKLDNDGKENSSGNTIGGRYGDIVIEIGISKQHSDNVVANQEVLTRQLENRREELSGVSINDEITNVIKFQKAYEANAKVISALTDMLDVLINRTGV